jgi:hypothetical protein
VVIVRHEFAFWEDRPLQYRETKRGNLSVTRAFAIFYVIWLLLVVEYSSLYDPLKFVKLLRFVVPVL